ncbi:MAG: hypothetical protein R6X16_08335 [Anaerolineae bacterium]
MSRVCGRLHAMCWSLPRFGFPFDATNLPRNGIYVLFEDGETGHGGKRIVRVGTHTGANQLPSRLHQHFLKENKDRSIFRKNVGRALLARDGDPFLRQWEIDLTTSAAKAEYAAQMDREKLSQTEQRVTEYMRRAFSFAVFASDDKTERLRWESLLVSTVSLCDECGPSDQWLGQHSPKARIRESGLWLVNELYKRPLSEAELGALEEMVRQG